VNPVQISPTTVFTDFTEPSGSWYSPKQALIWTPAVTEIDRAVAYADPVRWVYGTGQGAQAIYGMWATSLTTQFLLWAEARAPGPLVLANPVDQVMLYPRLTLRSDPGAQAPGFSGSAWNPVIGDEGAA
jgi:hypothetical protein